MTPTHSLQSHSYPRVLGEISVTRGSLDQHYIRVGTIIDRFPIEAIGGSNTNKMGTRQLTIDWGGGTPISTDIDGAKKIFRSRSLAKALYERHRASVGSHIIVEQTWPNKYRLSIRH